MASQHMALARGLLSRMGGAGASSSAPQSDVATIIEHLRFLLNCRRGSAVVAPDYGIDDLSDLATKFPDAIEVWKQSIQNAIETYEPRLTKVSVNHCESSNPLLIRFEISAVLVTKDRKAPVQFETQVDSTGTFEVW